MEIVTKMTSSNPFTSEKRVFTDARGSLVDMSNSQDLPRPELPPNINIYSFSINPGVSRGHHFHKVKKEWFFCTFGQVTVYLKDIETQCVYVEELTAFDGKLIYVPPCLAHCVQNKSKDQMAVMVSYSSRIHDPRSPDTYSADLSDQF